MKPTTFLGQNVVFAENQPEYTPLPALRLPDGQVITCWEISDEELEEITRTKKIYLSQLTFNTPLQQVMLGASLDLGISFIDEQS